MSQPQTITGFLVFCLEAYKVAEGLEGVAALDRFKRYGVFAYLSDGYDVLHTQSREALVQDIQAYLKPRMKN